jgi:transposase-like protein
MRSDSSKGMPVLGADHRSIFNLQCLDTDCPWFGVRFPITELPIPNNARFLCPGCGAVTVLLEGEPFDDLLLDAAAQHAWLIVMGQQTKAQESSDHA